MKIGEKIRIKLSLAGKDFAFCEGDILTISENRNTDTEIAIDTAEGLLRGGSAEAATFQDTPTTNQGQNADTHILPDDGKNVIEDGAKPDESAGSGVLRSDDDQGQPTRVHEGASDGEHPDELREDAPSSAEPEVSEGVDSGG